MRFLLQQFLLCSFLFISFCGDAQVKFYATVSPEIIHKDELTTFRMVIENSNNLEHISPPDFGNFILISGPNQESGMTNINGSVKSYLALTFILKPRKAGEYK